MPSVAALQAPKEKEEVKDEVEMNGGHKLLNGMRSMRWWEWVLAVVMTVFPLACSFTVTFATGQTRTTAAYRLPIFSIPPSSKLA